jgi:hypothetical protein
MLFASLERMYGKEVADKWKQGLDSCFDSNGDTGILSFAKSDQ